jgi:hypothetical protein
MRFAAVFLLAAALAAGPAAAGERELIRFRGPDGTPGLVDDADKLPPGAVILERSPLAAVKGQDEPAEPEDGERRSEDPERAPEDGDRAPEPAEPAAPPAHLDEAERAERCLQYGLSRGCNPREAAEAAGWCSRAQELHRAQEEAEENRVYAEEAYEDCRTASGTVPFCSRRRLDAAERQVEEADRSLERLEDECRSAECLPGWIRESCDR